MMKQACGVNHPFGLGFVCLLVCFNICRIMEVLDFCSVLITLLAIH